MSLRRPRQALQRQPDAVLADLVEDFRCPHCKQYMHPPIRQCSMGHNYCHNCHLRIRCCPICQQVCQRQNARAFVLEKLHAKLSFTCRFSSRGCPLKVPGPLIQRHEYSCKFGFGKCPLRRLNSCTWHGRSHQLIGHCMTHHKSNVFRTNIQKLTCTNFAAAGAAAATSYFLLFYAFHEFFKCIWEIDFESGIMRWCVYKMITERSDSGKVFDFLIEIPNQFIPENKLTVKGTCPIIEQNVLGDLNNHQYVITHYDMVKKFCKSDNLSYIVKIFPRHIAALLPQ